MTTTQQPLPQPKLRRFVELLVVPFAMAASIGTSAALWRDRLPDPIASHWGPSGAADASMSLDGATRAMTIVMIALWLLMLGILQSRKVGGTEARGLVATIYWAGAVLVAVWVLGLAANLDVDHWTDAGNLGAGIVFGALAAALPAAGLGWWLARGRPEVGAPRGIDATPMVADAGQTLVWVGHATNRVLIAISAAPLAAAAVAALIVDDLQPTFLLSLLAPALVLPLAARVRVAVGPAGATVTMGWLGWPRRSIEVDQIASVSVEDVVPMAYGGWGFRLARGTQAHVIRAGEGIRIARSGRSDVLVTVDDATLGARVLAGHLGDRPVA